MIFYHSLWDYWWEAINGGLSIPDSKPVGSEVLCFVRTITKLRIIV